MATPSFAVYGKPYIIFLKFLRLLFYYNYFIFCFFAVISSADIFPIFVDWVINKVIYLSAFFCFVYGLLFFKVRISKISLPFFWLLFFYFFASFIISFLDRGLESILTEWIAQGLYWPLCIFVFLISVDVFPFKSLLRPFIFSGLFLLLLSVFRFLGFSIPLYSNEAAVSTLNSFKSGVFFYSGVYINQNRFGLFLLTFIPVLFMSVALYRSKAVKIFLSFACLVSLMFIFLTVSRASILGLGVFYLGVIFGLRDENKAKLIFVVSVVLGGSLLFLFSDLSTLIFDRLSSGTTSGRTEIWSYALSQFYENPLSGVGDFSFDGLTAHNVYLQFLASWGGLVFLLWFLFYALAGSVCIYYLFKRPVRDKVLVVFSCSAVLSVLVHQVFETAINTPFSQASVFILLLISIVFRKAFGYQWAFKYLRFK
jgi:hypothetical protein